MSLESYNRADWNVITSKPMCAEGIQVVDKSNAIASKMGISGVPMFFTDDGRVIQGADITQTESYQRGTILHYTNTLPSVCSTML